jgi:hypothetical protein
VLFNDCARNPCQTTQLLEDRSEVVCRRDCAPLGCPLVSVMRPPANLPLRGACCRVFITCPGNTGGSAVVPLRSPSAELDEIVIMAAGIAVEPCVRTEPQRALCRGHADHDLA